MASRFDGSHFDLLADQRLEPLPGAEQPRRDGLDRTTENCGSVLIAEAFYFAEQEGLPELRRQHVDRLLDRFVRFARLGELVGPLVVAVGRDERLVVLACEVA